MGRAGHLWNASQNSFRKIRMSHWLFSKPVHFLWKKSSRYSLRALLTERNLNNLKREKEYIRQNLLWKNLNTSKRILMSLMLEMGHLAEESLWMTRPRGRSCIWLWWCRGQVKHPTWTRCQPSGARALGGRSSLWGHLHPNAAGPPWGHTRTSPGLPALALQPAFDSTLPSEWGAIGQKLALHLVILSMVRCYPGLRGGSF